MDQNQAEVLATFTKCPSCGSERRLMEELVNEQKEKGRVPKNTGPCLQLLSSAAVPPSTLMAGLVGTSVPTGTAILDACLDCGAIYAVQLLRGEIKLQPQMPGGLG